MVDHHLHIQSPEASRFLLEQSRRVPHVFKGISPVLLETRTAADALRVMDEAGMARAVLLSEAYVFTSPHFIQDGDDPAAPAQTRRENQYNVDAALQSNGRLKAFISVNPLHEGAADEVGYWAGREGVSGLKLHLSNSGFKPDTGSHLEALARMFEIANREGLPIVIHARAPSGSAADAALAIVEKVLPHAVDIPVQLAHAGGEGGLDLTTIEALKVYAEAIARKSRGTANLLFDLAVVAVGDDTPATLADSLLQSLAALMRQIGLSRFVMGSDWPAVCAPREHNALLQAQYCLTPAEWSILLRNAAPYMDTRRVVAS
jgi:predicted TIM-barrel fold metal-dependent hydrolase